MHYKKKKRSGKLAVIITLIVLLLVAVGATLFFTLGGIPGIKDEIQRHSPPPTPYISEGEVRAFTLEASGETQTEQAFRTHFQEAITFAKEGGFNTIVYKGKTNLTTYWRDDIFPAPEAVSAEDGFMKQLDPLAILCEEAAGQGVQIWLSIDIYASGNYKDTTPGKATDLARSESGLSHTRFSSTDAAYAALLTESINGLPQKYPLAGIVLSGLNAPETLADNGSMQPSTPQQQDAFAPSISQLITSLHTTWAENSYQTRLILAFDEKTTLISQQLATTFTSSQQVHYLLPTIHPGTQLSARLAAWSAAGPLVLAHPAEDTPATVLFTASRDATYAGTVFGGYPALQNEPTQLGVLKSALLKLDIPLPSGFDIPKTLAVTFPVAGGKYYYENVYLMGTSNPAEPLLLNGTPVESRAAGGAFGVLVPLQTGDNTFSLTNGAETLQHTVTRPQPGTGTSTPKPDATKPAEPGQAIEISSLIASALTDYANLSSINETLHIGAVAVVQESIQYTSGNTITHAYKLTSGDWVLASNCKLIPGTGASAFTGLTATESQGGETLTLEGTGTPVAYVAYQQDTNSLTLTMHNTSFTLPAGFQSRLVQSASVQSENGATILTLQLNTIWGYSLEYSGGKTTLFLKDPPPISTDPTRPLLGTRILLDPGHGGTDAGALGLGGEVSGPNEKHINLALAQGIAYRLRQLGAEVTLTREDNDTLPTLQDRLLAQTVQKPDFFLSVHHNSAELNADRGGAMGSQSYYFHPYTVPPSKQYAQNLISQIAPATSRGGTDAGWGYYYVTRTTVCPSVLFEYGFIINPKEFEDVTSTDGIYAAACATAAAIMQSMPTA